MRASERLAGVCIGVTLVVAVAMPAVAETSEEPVRLHYVAPRGCPDQDAFLALLRRRTSRARLVSGDEQARQMEIDVRQEKVGASGRFVIREPGGRTANRELHAPTCPQLVDGLALIVALAIDPNASIAALPPPAPVATVPAAAPTAPRSAPVPRARWVYGSGALAEVRTGVSPDALAGAGAFADARLERASALSPSFRLSAHASLMTVETSMAEASFRLASAALETCPLRLRVSGHLAISPCASFEAGVLQVASRLPTGRADNAPWLGVSVEGRVQLLLGQGVFLELDGGVHFPLLQHEVTFLQGSVLVYEVPLVAAKAGFGLGVQFP